MTRQEIFDKVASHLLTQNAKSTLPINLHEQMSSNLYASCAYRGEYGMACAIGCLIPDELYEERYEKKSMDHCDVLDLLTKLGFADEFSLLNAFQCVHDQYNVSDWYEKLLDISASYGINSLVLKNFKQV